jgi:hypothetical protein
MFQIMGFEKESLNIYLNIMILIYFVHIQAVKIVHRLC